MGEDFVDDPDVPPLEFVPAATSTWPQKWLYTTMCSPSLFSSFRHSFNCSFRKKRRKKKRKKKFNCSFLQPAAAAVGRGASTVCSSPLAPARRRNGFLGKVFYSST